MIPEQLDLFGGPPKPPKKIKVDDGPAIIYPEPFKPAPAEQEKEVLPEPEVPQEAKSTPTPHLQAPLAEAVDESHLTEGEAIDNATFNHISEITAAADAVADEVDDRQASTVQEEGEEEWPEEEEETNGHLQQEHLTETAVSAKVEESGSSGESVLADKVPFEPELGNIPPDEVLFRRQYYSMRETATMFNISHSMLRYWENEFDVLQPRKNKKGDRYFRPVDIKNLQVIYHLLKVRRFTLDGAREYLRNHNKALDNFELIKKLEKVKAFLLELKVRL